jgi:hypothetical protein
MSAEDQKRILMGLAVRLRNALVFDRNYVAFQILSRAFSSLVGLPMTTARLERYIGCPC